MKRQLQVLIALATIGLVASTTFAKEYHVSVNGCNTNKGSKSKPFKTIQAAANIAQPGDVITVHEGVYRERVNPPRGGTSDKKRITYRTAKGEKVVIKGSEIVKGWEKVQDDTWKVVIPNTFFGNFNPFNDLIHGDWFLPLDREHHTGAVYLNGDWLIEAATQEDILKPIDKKPLWFGQVDDKNTTIWAQFKNINPNDADVEINVRQTVFYPDKTGVNYITVRGFTMMQAATPWAPPTAEQIGLLGTHWSKGWIIEDNDISYSTCVGVTLGKYGDQWDNTSQNTAEGYVKTIERALENGWSKENIGHHIVRNNHISHCEQAGLVGSLGAVFSTITGNTIHDIHTRRLFSGFEMAGIKIHAAIDTTISHNYIYRARLGIWLDWMAQGARVTRNLLTENDRGDLYAEVNHGPLLVDNNLFFSSLTFDDVSHSTACVHNLFAGKVRVRPELNRRTPYHKPHSTDVVHLSYIHAGDNRFYNNIFIGNGGLDQYANETFFPSFIDGNIYLNGASPYPDEKHHVVMSDFDPKLKLIEKDGSVYLHMTLPEIRADWKHQLVTTELLGKAVLPKMQFENRDGTPLKLNKDYFGKKRNKKDPSAGPFKEIKQGQQSIKVWSVK